MKRILIILIFINLLIGCKLNKLQSVNNINENIYEIMYVNNPRGLSVYSLPSDNSKLVGVLVFLSEVMIEKNKIINNENWDFIIHPLFEGWIFSGNLFDKNGLEQIFIGDWMYDKQIFAFDYNGKFEKIFYEKNYSLYGCWELINNNLIISINMEKDNNIEIFKYEYHFYYYEHLNLLINENEWIGLVKADRNNLEESYKKYVSSYGYD
ncbi:MAG: hypothetical protein FWD28_07640 [Treponema sp.]|nr:hypothetical protein [Treponema sp.]